MMTINTPMFHGMLDFSHVQFSSKLWVLMLPLALMGLDIVTGLVKAWSNEDFKSKKMRTGLSKKIGEIAIIVIGELFQYSLNLPTYIMTCVSLYIVFMELMSVVENLNELGVPLPAFVTKALQTVDESLQKEDLDDVIEGIESITKED